MKAARLEVKVWREMGFEDGDPIAWRAQVYFNRKDVMSPIGVGPSRDEAIADCMEKHRLLAAEKASAAATVEWVPIGAVVLPPVHA
jgi:hypothetical protein